MKRVIFFDIDNTMFSHNEQKIPSQTIKLIKELAQDENTVLGLATGRGPSKLYILEELSDLFKVKVLINGALAYNEEKLIYSSALDKNTISKIVDNFAPNISVGFVGKDKEVLNNSTDEARYSLKGYAGMEELEVDGKYYLDNDVFQVWVFDPNREKIEKVALEFPHLRVYHWHQGGSDYVGKNINKAVAIKKIMANYPGYQIITIGDGHNDIDMIKLADIGIAMDNSGSLELKESADLIAPDINTNQLYDFFKKEKLI